MVSEQQSSLVNPGRITANIDVLTVDKVLDDCFQLISLSFMTIGRNKEAPAVYATLSTIKVRSPPQRLMCSRLTRAVASPRPPYGMQVILRKGSRIAHCHSRVHRRHYQARQGELLTTPHRPSGWPCQDMPHPACRIRADNFWTLTSVGPYTRACDLDLEVHVGRKHKAKRT